MRLLVCDGLTKLPSQAGVVQAIEESRGTAAVIGAMRIGEDDSGPAGALEGCKDDLCKEDC